MITYFEPEAETTYNFIMEVTDSFGGVTTYTTTTGGASRILSVRPKGKGLAVGKLAEADDTFECGWKAEFNKNVTVTGNIILNGGLQDSAGNDLLAGNSDSSTVTPVAPGITSNDFTSGSILYEPGTTNQPLKISKGVSRDFTLLTVENPGIYLITVSTSWHNANNSGVLYAGIRLNSYSTSYTETRIATPTTHYPILNIATVLKLSLNDKLKLVLNQTADSEIQIGQCQYQIVRLGG